MRIIILLFICLIFYSCSKPRTVLICGDHKCVNKTEAEKYFEENLSIEVKIINDKKRNNIDLVQLNLQKNSENKRKVSIKKKNKLSQQLKPLSKLEIKKIKTDLKKKNRDKKIAKKKGNKSQSEKKLLDTDKMLNNRQIKKIEKSLKKNKSAKTTDICTIIKKCSIEEISKFLIKEGNKKSFPNISTRE